MTLGASPMAGDGTSVPSPYLIVRVPSLPGEDLASALVRLARAGFRLPTPPPGVQLVCVPVDSEAVQQQKVPLPNPPMEVKKAEDNDK